MTRTMTPADFPSRLFITGTDTGIGKTVVAAILLAGLGGCYWKPVQSGLDETTDTDWLRQKTALPEEHFFAEGYRLPRPASPHLAAASAGLDIELDQLTPPPAPPGATLLIEGAGGVMVPLNQTCLMTDLIKKTAAPVLVVAADRLGMINHTLLTVTHLRHLGIPVFGVVINGNHGLDNRQAVTTFGRVPVLAQIEHMPEITPPALADQFGRFKKKD
ncbi:MAG: dethiobiotin synthase [Desulfosudaceae bacterium]